MVRQQGSELSASRRYTSSSSSTACDRRFIGDALFDNTLAMMRAGGMPGSAMVRFASQMNEMHRF